MDCFSCLFHIPWVGEGRDHVNTWPPLKAQVPSMLSSTEQALSIFWLNSMEWMLNLWQWIMDYCIYQHLKSTLSAALGRIRKFPMVISFFSYIVKLNYIINFSLLHECRSIMGQSCLQSKAKWYSNQFMFELFCLFLFLSHVSYLGLPSSAHINFSIYVLFHYPSHYLITFQAPHTLFFSLVLMYKWHNIFKLRLSGPCILFLQSSFLS